MMSTTYLGKKTILCFVTEHGFGHASRTCAVLETMYEQNWIDSALIISKIPEDLFNESLTFPFIQKSFSTDVGLIQKDAFEEDIPATVRALEQFFPFREEYLLNMVKEIEPFTPFLIWCDIGPLGIELGQYLDLPVILHENFRWDWIYEGYPDFNSELSPYIKYFQSLWEKVTIHLQSEALCAPWPKAPILNPIARKRRSSNNTLRQQLALDPSKKTVLITMGGVPSAFSYYDQLEKLKGMQFILPGNHPDNTSKGNLRILKHHSGFYHPDLMGVADVVIGKVGYSTIAEMWNHGKRFGYISRPHFRESPPLAAYIDREISSLEISQDKLQKGTWISSLDELLSLPETSSNKINGADQVLEVLRTAGIAPPIT